MTTDRLPNNQEDREVYLHEHNAANFVKAVSDALRDSVDTVIMTVKTFAGEPDVLYVAARLRLPQRHERDDGAGHRARRTALVTVPSNALSAAGYQCLTQSLHPGSTVSS
jgi:hypothetical protein